MTSLADGFIYALTDPRINNHVLSVRYIGMTRKALDKRLIQHLSEARSRKVIFHRLSWIRGLVADGVLPQIICLERQPYDRLVQREIELIAAYREAGSNLVNSTAGGEGNRDPSPETREKIRAHHLGHKWNVGHVPSVETREKIRIANTGHHHSESTRKKLHDVLLGTDRAKGHVVSIEARQKISQKKKGVPHIWTDEAREKNRRSHLARLERIAMASQDRLF